MYQLAAIFFFVTLFSLNGCDQNTAVATQTELATPEITKNADGTTLEQDSIRAYREEFSDPRAIKHLYVINDQGDCIFYDTVRGKVTSGNKRLRPKTIVAAGNNAQYGTRLRGIGVVVDGTSYETNEVPSFDGTWGSSEAYIFWRNATGQFRKLSLGAGMSTLVTTAPIRAIKARIEIVTTADEVK